MRSRAYFLMSVFLLSVVLIVLRGIELITLKEKERNSDVNRELPFVPFVVCIMALWDEALTLPLALDSSRHFVNEFIVVHKKGNDDTFEVLQKCILKWGLRVRYFESNLTLRQARLFAISVSNAYADVYLLQDGDEVMYHRGPTAISNALPLLFNSGYEAIASKMVYLKHNLVSTFPDQYRAGGAGKWGGFPANGIILIPHLTIFRNLPNIVMPTALTEDVPVVRGNTLVLHDPWKFDISIKHPIREYLRAWFLDWSREGSPGRIEDFAVSHDHAHQVASAENSSWTLADTALRYVKENFEGTLSRYNENEWHTYPDAIRIYIEAGYVRGYEGKELLSFNCSDCAPTFTAQFVIRRGV